MNTLSKLALTLAGATCLVGIAMATPNPMINFIVPHGSTAAQEYHNTTYIFYAITSNNGNTSSSAIAGMSEDGSGTLTKLPITTEIDCGHGAAPKCPPIYMVATAGTTNNLQQAMSDPILGKWTPVTIPSSWNYVQFSPSSWHKTQ